MDNLMLTLLYSTCLEPTEYVRHVQDDVLNKIRMLKEQPQNPNNDIQNNENCKEEGCSTDTVEREIQTTVNVDIYGDINSFETMIKSRPPPEKIYFDPVVCDIHDKLFLKIKENDKILLALKECIRLCEISCKKMYGDDAILRSNTLVTDYLKNLPEILAHPKILKDLNIKTVEQLYKHKTQQENEVNILNDKMKIVLTRLGRTESDPNISWSKQVSNAFPYGHSSRYKTLINL